jgi:hypothetical protein
MSLLVTIYSIGSLLVINSFSVVSKTNCNNAERMFCRTNFQRSQKLFKNKLAATPDGENDNRDFEYARTNQRSKRGRFAPEAEDRRIKEDDIFELEDLDEDDGDEDKDEEFDDVIPNALLDQIDPDGVVDRIPELLRYVTFSSLIVYRFTVLFS